MPFPCHAVTLMVLIVSLHITAVFDSHMPCRARAMPRPCRSEIDFSRPRYSAAWARHGMCELASAVQRRHVGDLLAFGFFQLPRGVPRRLLLEASNPLNCRTSSSDITGYYADFHGHGTVGEWQVAAWYVWIKVAWHGRETTWERHGCSMACVN
jgi:hypothetical protein